VAEAENDLKNAAHTLKLGRACPTDTVCFHAQQRAEKYLKAYLVWKHVPFRKTHAIKELVELMPRDTGLGRGFVWSS
jgi:HEPN domain-containing protein